MDCPSPGDVVVRRYFRAGLLTMAHATRFVADTPLGWLLRGAVGAGYATRRRPDGTAVREDLPSVLAAAPLATTAWQDLDVLILHRRDRPHAVWWCYRRGDFVGWYVNLEEPAVPWSAGVTCGIDTVDQTLDVLVSPDRTGAWKDVDEFRWATGRPGFWTPRQARRIRAEGHRVLLEAAECRFPFDGTWCDAPPPRPAGGPPQLTGTTWWSRPPAVDSRRVA